MPGGELREYVDTGDVSLEARDLRVQAGSKVLLDSVSFPIPERCLLGVIGPSGAGKSTLLGALTGMRPADSGSVLYDNRDLYRDYAELRHRIGLVPQDNIMHTHLTARRALNYAAELRFPGDTSKRERTRRVSEVMEELGLTSHANTRADRLSGGQQKRVNVALELLTKPSLLFLDEPTSGLDPGLDKSVMEQMRDLAHDGRTVVVVTHSVDNLDTCDRLAAQRSFPVARSPTTDRRKTGWRTSGKRAGQRSSRRSKPNPAAPGRLSSARPGNARAT